MKKILVVFTLCCLSFICGCKNINNTMFEEHPIAQDQISKYNKILTVDGSYNEQEVVDKIKEQMLHAQSIIPEYEEIYKGRDSYGKKSYDIRGASIQELPRNFDNNAYSFKINYKKGYKTFDDRKKTLDGYRVWECFAHNSIVVNVYVSPISNSKKKYTIENSPILESKDGSMFIERIPSYPKTIVEQDVRERIDSVTYR